MGVRAVADTRVAYHPVIVIARPESAIQSLRRKGAKELPELAQSSRS
jgi:hypothetical protein